MPPQFPTLMSSVKTITAAANSEIQCMTTAQTPVTTSQITKIIHFITQKITWNVILLKILTQQVDLANYIDGVGEYDIDHSKNSADHYQHFEHKGIQDVAAISARRRCCHFHVTNYAAYFEILAIFGDEVVENCREPIYCIK